MPSESIDRTIAEKERGLLEQDYATPCPKCGGVVFDWSDTDTCRDCEDSNDETSTEQATLMTDGGTEKSMQVGTQATVRVSIVMDYYVDIEMPPDGDPGEHADFELFARQDYDDYAEKDVLNTEILEQEPVYEDEYDTPEDWPSHV